MPQFHAHLRPRVSGQKKQSSVYSPDSSIHRLTAWGSISGSPGWASTNLTFNMLHVQRATIVYSMVMLQVIPCCSRQVHWQLTFITVTRFNPSKRHKTDESQQTYKPQGGKPHLVSPWQSLGFTVALCEQVTCAGREVSLEEGNCKLTAETPPHTEHTCSSTFSLFIQWRII